MEIIYYLHNFLDQKLSSSTKFETLQIQINAFANFEFQIFENTSKYQYRQISKYYTSVCNAEIITRKLFLINT